MAAQDYTAVVQQLYISYFGRPADYFGLQNFSAQLDAMGAPKTFAEVQAAVQADAAGTTALSKLINTFNNSAESAALYGTDNTQIGISKFVANIYQNVLGREADTAGFNFWVNAITSGGLSKANAAAAITQGALNNTSDQGKLDALTVQNKLNVATAFTTALDTPTEFNAYAGDNAAATGRSLLQGVNSSTNVTSYQANINDAINTIVNVAVPGSTSALTIGVDTFNGTAGDDVFNAIPQNAQGANADTLGAFDVIDGGAGKDTLNIYTGKATVDGATVTYNTVQQGTVKNVETINIYGQTGALFGGAAGVDASKFVGATNINQAGIANKVVNLAAGTTASFTTVTGATALDVGAAASATSLKVALTNVTGATADNKVTLSVHGDTSTGGSSALSSVTVSGSIAKADTSAAAAAASLVLNVTSGTTSTGASVDKVSINTAVKTTLNLTETGTGHVTTIDASASTGGISYASGTAAAPTAVSNLLTGSGNDVINVVVATAAAAGSTAAKNASISTGAGKDDITIASATGSTGGTITVDAGAGDDTITVAKTAGVGLNILGGEGNDTVVLTGTLATTDVIDGGAGTDTISVGGSTATRTADDFIVFNKLLKNFETIKFSTAEGKAGTPAIPGTDGADDTPAVAAIALDASKLGANYTTIDLADDSFVAKVGTQTIVANGDLNVSASGYSAETASADAVYAGTLNITSKGLKTTVDSVTTYVGNVTANADVVKLTVTGNAGGDTITTLTGDAKSAIVTLNNGLNTAGTVDTLAKFELTTSATNDSAMTSVTLSGTGSAKITNQDKSALVTVDASNLGGKYTVGTNAGNAIKGLEYTSTNTAVETIKLGAGIDKVSIGASTYGAMDTVTGLNLVLAADGKSIDTTKSDSLTLGTIDTKDVVKFTSTQTDFDLLLKDAAASMTTAHTVVFAFGGDTYIYHDAGTANAVDAADTIVKLTGTIDQNALILDLGGKIA